MIALALAILAISVVILLKALAERDIPTEVEVEEYEDWAWPARSVGPAGRTHLGRRP